MSERIDTQQLAAFNLYSEGFCGALVKRAQMAVSTPLEVAREFHLVRTQGSALYDLLDTLSPSAIPYAAYLLNRSEQTVRVMTLQPLLNPVSASDEASVPYLARQSIRRSGFWFVFDRDRYCPECLRDEGMYKIGWRLRPVTVCPFHQVLLEDHCSSCGSTGCLRTYLRARRPLAWPEFVDGPSGTVMRWSPDPAVLKKCGSCGARLDGAGNRVGGATASAFNPLIESLEAYFRADAGLAEPDKFLELFFHVARLHLAVGEAGSLSGLPGYEGSLQFVGRPQQGALANTAAAHALSIATLLTLREGPTGLRELISRLPRRGRGIRGLLPLHGPRSQWSIPLPVARELGRSGRVMRTRQFMMLQLGSMALHDRPSGPLTAGERYAALVVLWTDETSAPPLVTNGGNGSLPNVSATRATFRAMDALLAAIEEDGSITPERQEMLRPFLKYWNGRVEFNAFLERLRVIALRRRSGAPFGTVLFFDHHSPASGISDYAWLAVRPLLPPVWRSPRPVKLRRLMEAVVSQLGKTEDLGRNADRLDYQRYQRVKMVGLDALWPAVHAFADMAVTEASTPVNIRGESVSEQLWESVGLTEILQAPRWFNGVNPVMPRQVLNVFLESWLVAEMPVNAATVRAHGFAHKWGALSEWVPRWWAEGRLERALRELEVALPGTLLGSLCQHVRTTYAPTDRELRTARVIQAAAREPRR